MPPTITQSCLFPTLCLKSPAFVRCSPPSRLVWKSQVSSQTSRCVCCLVFSDPRIMSPALCAHSPAIVTANPLCRLHHLGLHSARALQFAPFPTSQVGWGGGGGGGWISQDTHFLLCKQCVTSNIYRIIYISRSISSRKSTEIPVTCYVFALI